MKPGKKGPLGSNRKPAISAATQSAPFHIGPKIAPPMAIGTNMKLIRMKPISIAKNLPSTTCSAINIPHKIVK